MVLVGFIIILYAQFFYNFINIVKVTSSDIIRLAQYLANWKVTINEKAADVNRDGKLTSSDIIKLAQLLAGWNV